MDIDRSDFVRMVSDVQEMRAELKRLKEELKTIKMDTLESAARIADDTCCDSDHDVNELTFEQGRAADMRAQQIAQRIRNVIETITREGPR